MRPSGESEVKRCADELARRLDAEAPSFGEATVAEALYQLARALARVRK